MATETQWVSKAIARALPEDLAPVDALRAVADASHSVFLESGGEISEGARWTMLAFDPLWRVSLRDGALWQEERRLVGAPLEALRDVWPAPVLWENAPPIPFRSGLAGYVGYDFKDCVERFPSRARLDSSLPDLSLGYYDVVWAWDRSTGRGWVVSSDSRRLEEQWERLVRAPRAAGGEWVPPRAIRSNFTRDEYLRAVERALEHIAAGDIYQVNLAQRFEAELACDPLRLYLRLRESSPAPFSSFLTLPEGAIASSSPERFFRVEERTIETWPIKGTRPRGRDRDDDALLEAALRASEKDRAENVMIVDLERNDLGRVCEIGSVEVPSLCEVASYANVHHLVSRVRGVLREDVHPADVWRALFPGGSITGAPKIRAVEIIDALEPVRRGVYTGAIGYWDLGGSCDWNIAIRTMVMEQGRIWFHAGGGIVADSTPEGEYEETRVKASAMMRALGP